ncbi:hypothetical protein MAR_031473 [Mya arenaria]|uniref:Uncharacterized protein n=1 Tax=Mya arenaria TaxID=6604 RepID=A0ABY7F7Y3_MYAAR|nr:hypothetical protein MAR_031473 [Mya arenaria]
MKKKSVNEDVYIDVIINSPTAHEERRGDSEVKEETNSESERDQTHLLETILVNSEKDGSETPPNMEKTDLDNKDKTVTECKALTLKSGVGKALYAIEIDDQDYQDIVDSYVEDYLHTLYNSDNDIEFKANSYGGQPGLYDTAFFCKG